MKTERIVPTIINTRILEHIIKDMPFSEKLAMREINKGKEYLLANEILGWTICCICLFAPFIVHTTLPSVDTMPVIIMGVVFGPVSLVGTILNRYHRMTYKRQFGCLQAQLVQAYIVLEFPVTTLEAVTTFWGRNFSDIYDDIIGKLTNATLKVIDATSEVEETAARDALKIMFDTTVENVGLGHDHAESYRRLFKQAAALSMLNCGLQTETAQGKE